MSRLSSLSFILATALVFLLLALAQYYVFMVVPNEQIMGAVQRVFYFHVGGALACYAAFGVVFVASITYLATRSERADLLSIAAGEVGFVLCTIVLVTGMIWGHSAWNTWFRWEEPRLVTFLVLWLIFLSFSVLRNFGDPTKSAVHGSILGILGAISVPIVYVSIKFLPQSARLHPEVIERGGLKDPSYWQAFGLSVVALMALCALLIWVRYAVGALEREVSLLGGRDRNSYDG
ncbi:MAG: cytochrome c biogenesis protein CcsA [Pseudomonadota bacterium]|jgi:heme exporter protein C